MEIVSIPRKITKKGELVVIPRKEYEELLRIQKKRKFYTELDKDLDKAIRDYQTGKYYGPFDSVEESKKFLESRSKKKVKK